MLSRSAVAYLFLLGCISMLLLTTVSSVSVFKKSLAGPPSEFYLHQIPSPLAGAIVEDSALLLVTAQPLREQSEEISATGFAKVPLSVDSKTSFSFSVLTKPDVDITPVLYNPRGDRVSLLFRSIPGDLLFGNTTLSTLTYEIERPETGVYQLVIFFHNYDVSSPKNVWFGRSKVSSQQQEQEGEEQAQTYLGKLVSTVAKHLGTALSPASKLVSFLPTSTPASRLSSLFETVSESFFGLPSSVVDHHAQNDESQNIDALVFVANESPIKVFSRVSSYRQLKGERIGLVAQLYEKAGDAEESSVFTEHPSSLALQDGDELVVTLSVVFPDGEIESVPMRDDGLNADFGANDGVYGGSVNATLPGNYIARALFNLTNRDGLKRTSVVRTSQHVLVAVDSDLSLTEGSTIAVAQNPVYRDVFDLYVPVSDSDNDANTYRIYGELYGTNASSGADAAVCWIASLVEVANVNNSAYSGKSVALQLNKNWLRKAGKAVTGPFTLKNVVVQDVRTYLVVSNATSLNVDLNQKFLKSKRMYNEDDSLLEITEEMRMGPRPDKFKHTARLAESESESVSASSSGKLVLVHGYCSPSNPWSAYKTNFTNPVFFESPLSSDTNDAFAKKVAAYVDSLNISLYSAVGYSQGGMVISHLRNYYWSGLDLNNPANKGRILQSVVTPYQGSSASGNVAAIGKVLGVGCGSNSDLSKDGAVLWLAGITNSTRADVWYYYVSFASSPAYCNRASNMFLAKPNDGAVETTLAPLPGGNLAAYSLGACHAKDMQYLPAFMNVTRNVEIDKLAARF